MRPVSPPVAPKSAGSVGAGGTHRPLTWGLGGGETGPAALCCALGWVVYIMTMKYVGDQYDMANICSGTSDTYQLTKI